MISSKTRSKRMITNTWRFPTREMASEFNKKESPVVEGYQMYKKIIEGYCVTITYISLER